jgi:LmbE family N-acetylglucosaminyl deacetylase
MKLTRRDLLAGAGMAGVGMTGVGMTGAGILGASPAASALAKVGLPPYPSPAGAAFDAGRKLKAIVAGGHPGDPEYGCGGVINRLSGLGHDVVLLYLNDGAWPPTSSTIRIAEATKACEILKARPLYANQRNGHAIVDNDHYEAYAKLLEAEKPDLVLTQWPIDNHRDHRAITSLTYDAWNHSSRSFALYYYEVSDGEDTLQFSPTHYIDITAAEPAKRAACYAHASQTPDRYYKLQDDVAAFRGMESGFQRAEAFVLQQRSPSDPLQLLMGR